MKSKIPQMFTHVYAFNFGLLSSDLACYFAVIETLYHNVDPGMSQMQKNYSLQRWLWSAY